MIFEEVVDRTASKGHSLKQFEAKKPRMEIQKFWTRLVKALDIEEETEK